MPGPAAWVPCDCGEYRCTLHPGQHASECPCPEIEVWRERGIDPYTERP